jgi:hypothetical protein
MRFFYYGEFGLGGGQITFDKLLSTGDELDKIQQVKYI